mgnify:CR=1 FL=1
MRIAPILKIHKDMTCRSPAGQMMAAEVIAGFLLRLARHRRVMRLAGRISGRRQEMRS